MQIEWEYCCPTVASDHLKSCINISKLFQNLAMSCASENEHKAQLWKCLVLLLHKPDLFSAQKGKRPSGRGGSWQKRLMQLTLWSKAHGKMQLSSVNVSGKRLRENNERDTIKRWVLNVGSCLLAFELSDMLPHSDSLQKVVSCGC